MVLVWIVDILVDLTQICFDQVQFWIVVKKETLYTLMVLKKLSTSIC